MNNSNMYKDTAIKGVCLTMCPTQERILRIRENLYHSLECKLDSTGKRTRFPDSLKFVKEYSRSAADQSISPFTVRPFPVLKKTVVYLLSHITTCEDKSWREIYDFVSDRLRAIQKDITVQDLLVEEILDVLAPMARFYLYSHYRLCETNHPEFDSFLNLKQLNHTLLNINAIFKKFDYKIEKSIGISTTINRRSQGIPPPEVVFAPIESREKGTIDNQEPTPNGPNKLNDTFDDVCDHFQHLLIAEEEEEEDSIRLSSTEPVSHYSIIEEMMSLYLLVNLGTEESIANILELPTNIRNGPLLQRVLNGCIWWLTGNYFPLLRLVTILPPLFCCAIHLHLSKIQRHALGSMSVAYNSPNLKYSLDDLESSLLSPSNALKEACVHYGLSVVGNEAHFRKTAFNWEASLMKPTKAEWLDAKLSSIPVNEILLPPVSNNNF